MTLHGNVTQHTLMIIVRTTVTVMGLYDALCVRRDNSYIVNVTVGEVRLRHVVLTIGLISVICERQAKNLLITGIQYICKS